MSRNQMCRRNFRKTVSSNTHLSLPLGHRPHGGALSPEGWSEILVQPQFSAVLQTLHLQSVLAGKTFHTNVQTGHGCNATLEVSWEKERLLGLLGRRGAVQAAIVRGVPAAMHTEMLPMQSDMATLCTECTQASVCQYRGL
jgi:hypothetical protein